MNARTLALTTATLLLAPGAALAQSYPANDSPAYPQTQRATRPLAEPDAGSMPLANRFGIGVTNAQVPLADTEIQAPIGVRYWGQGFGFAAGLGFAFDGNEQDPTGDDIDDEHIEAQWALSLSGMIPLYIGQSSVLFGALTLSAARDYNEGSDDDLETIHSSRIGLSFGPQIGIEAFMGALGLPELSFLGTIGLPLAYGFGPEFDGDRETDWRFGTDSSPISLVAAAVGFHYYFSL